MEKKRSAGVLCHISSLPGEYGIGALGKEAYKFASRLKKSGVSIWQILPLVQTGYGDSPYQSVACDSGNPYFIDLERLKKQKLLTGKELKALRKKYRGMPLDYGALYEERYATLRRAFSRFNFDDEKFRSFVKAGRFEDYALFMTAKTVYGGGFCDWEEDLKRHEPEAVARLCTEYHEEYQFWQFVQYELWMQWEELHAYCKKLGIRILGDLPLYVAYDSADVWAHPELFKLTEDLKPEKVAGVPPDYFAEDGQLWGNPVYDWAAHEKENFAWWTARLKTALSTYDLVRIDHFRGIDRYFEIPASAATAREGTWCDGPKERLFFRLGEEKRRIIAEDLGSIDEGVRALLKKTGFPGMKVLLFAFNGDEENEYLPKNIGENSVVYTGTHDNNTVQGYIDGLSTEEFILFRSRVAAALEEAGVAIKLGAHGEGLSEAIVRLALASKAQYAIVPIQDILGLGEETRMNLPGRDSGNWQFRLAVPCSGYDMAKLKKMIKIYRR